MRRRVLLAVAIVLPGLMLGRPAGAAAALPPPKPDSAPAKAKAAVRELLAIAAGTHDEPLRIRTAALDTLGLLAPKQDPPTTSLLVSGLKGLLQTPPRNESERAFFVWHAVQALGRVGPPAIEALPDLVRAKGLDPVVNAAIDDAIRSVATPAAGPATGPPPKRTRGTRPGEEKGPEKPGLDW
jgi:hypothetical protein